VLDFDPQGVAAATTSYAARVAGRSDIDVALDFVAHVRGRAAGDDERVLLDDAFAAVRAAEAGV
jgi:exonuclease SbcD